MTGGSERETVARNHRRIGDLTFDEKRVIRERHFGWEQATPGLLADVFLTTPQTITAVLNWSDDAPLHNPLTGISQGGQVSIHGEASAEMEARDHG